jgi:hypothetical protein
MSKTLPIYKPGEYIIFILAIGFQTNNHRLQNLPFDGDFKPKHRPMMDEDEKSKWK